MQEIILHFPTVKVQKETLKELLKPYPWKKISINLTKSNDPWEHGFAKPGLKTDCYSIDKLINFTLSSMYLKITATLASGHVFIISITYKSAQNNFGAIFFCENPKT